MSLFFGHKSLPTAASGEDGRCRLTQALPTRPHVRPLPRLSATSVPSSTSSMVPSGRPKAPVQSHPLKPLSALLLQPARRGTAPPEAPRPRLAGSQPPAGPSVPGAARASSRRFRFCFAFDDGVPSIGSVPPSPLLGGLLLSTVWASFSSSRKLPLVTTTRCYKLLSGD